MIRILCSAIWYKDMPTAVYNPYNVDRGVVLCGWRHANIIHQMKALTGKRTVSNGPDAAGESVQGFLTSDNRFVTREEAAVIAYDAKQIRYRIKSLMSEDLY